MKMKKAMKTIQETKEKGYMVCFEVIEGDVLRGDYFPDKHAGEALIEKEEDAWVLAKRFAAKTYGKMVNIYVIDSSFSPVKGYKEREIKNR